MSDPIEEFFTKMNRYREDRREQLLLHRKHHEACIKEIDSMLEDLKDVPESYEDLLKKYTEPQ